jgi:putative transposase
MTEPKTPPATATPLHPMGEVIKIDESLIRGRMVKGTRESAQETLNAMLDAEAQQLRGAKRYVRHPERVDTRASRSGLQLHTKAGDVTRRAPKLRNPPFATAIIERYRRRKRSVEEATLEMDYAGGSTRRVEDITEALWGARVRPSTVSELNQKIAGQIEAWRQQSIQGRHAYAISTGSGCSAIGRRGQEREHPGRHRPQCRGLPRSARGRRRHTEDKASWQDFRRTHCVFFHSASEMSCPALPMGANRIHSRG